MEKTMRKIIEIEEEKCNGCGLCVDACHEGALAMVNGKAKLVSDTYCDGLGDCLPQCPADAIRIVEREAEAYDEELVKARMADRVKGHGHMHAHGGGCPSAAAKTIRHSQAGSTSPAAPFQESQLSSWPVQIKLVHPRAPFLEDAHLLIAADCTAFAYANIQQEFMRGRVVLVGCPKLDEADYAAKLTEIISGNDIQSVTVLRMEVPCCTGIVNAAKEAIAASGKTIPWGYHTISISGEMLGL